MKYKDLKKRYSNLKTIYDQNKPLWDRIAKYVGIAVNTNYKDGTITSGQQVDDYIEDPTAALAVQQAGDYMHGIMWGTGEKAITLEPSDAVLELADEEMLKGWYDWATDRTLYHVNHSESGTNTALKGYHYDQVAFGTSGVGAFLNEQFMTGVKENALTMRGYGIDTIVIDEGKNGLIDTVFINYRWRVSRIINEFCILPNGELDKKQLAKMPKKIQDDYKEGNINNEHNIIHAVIPRVDFDPKLKGKKGAEYLGAWFSEQDGENIFYEEDYIKMPIAVARLIKIRGEIYGRASGTLIIGTIASVNYMVGQVFQILEKMQSPPLGIWNSALFGDSVLDTSADSITAFNPELSAGAGKTPIFPIHDVGDPTGIIKFLLPYLNDKIATAFKIDVLLDFNAEGDRTATEMMQRAIIRGKNLSGMLQQQKIEMYDRWLDRCISLLWQLKVYGIDASIMADKALELKQLGQEKRIIPEAVLECQRRGIKWYKIRYNGELDRLTRGEALERIMQGLNGIVAIASVYPDIIHAIDWYSMCSDINKNLGLMYIKSEEEFKQTIMDIAQKQQMMMAAQAQNQASNAKKNMSSAEKMDREAQNA